MILRTEFSTLVKLLHRMIVPSKLCLMTSVVVVVGERVVRYVRVVEHGSTTGLVQCWISRLRSVMDVDIVVDYQVTSDTVMSLRSYTPTRNRDSDVTDCLKLWNTICATSTEPSLRLSCIFIASVKQEDVFTTFNIDKHMIEGLIVQLAQAPRSFNLNKNFLLTQPRLDTPLPIEKQLELVNCLPPQYVHFPYTLGAPSWNHKSLKQAAIDGCLRERLEWQESRFDDRQQPPKRQRPSTPSSHRARQLRAVESACHPILVSMKQEFVAKGFFRIIQRTSLRATILWNAYDCTSGRLIEGDYVISHVYYGLDGTVSFVNCERCAHATFNNRGLQESTCAHSVLLKANPCNQQPLGHQEFTNAFETWMQQQAVMPCSTTKLSQRGGSTNFLVVLDEDSPIAQIHTRVSLCRVQVRAGSVQIRCTNAACIAHRRVVLSKAKSTRNRPEFQCAHIRILLASNDFSSIESTCNFNAIESDSESVSDNEMSFGNVDNVESGDEFQSNELETSDIIESATSSNGVFWDGEKWETIDSCSQSTIPLEESDDCKQWRFRRLTGKDIQNQEAQTICTSKIGTPCIPPPICPSCSSQLQKHTLSNDLAVHTRIGTVYRKRHTLWCASCKQEIHWNASTEYIHTISNGRHGGMILLYCTASIDDVCVFVYVCVCVCGSITLTHVRCQQLDMNSSTTS